MHWTYRDYKNWNMPEGTRCELIHGVVRMMSVPNDAHQAVSGEMSRQIANQLHGKPCKVRTAPYDVRLFYEETDEDSEDDDTVVQPDITVLCDEKKRGKEGCRGAPNLVIEILSPSTKTYDLNNKLSVYLEAGVPECWMIGIEEREITVYTLQNREYTAKSYAADDSIEAGSVSGLSVNMKLVFAEL